MTPLGLDWLQALLRQSVSGILSLHPVPKHIAFIMDGNRRYAERQNLATVQGHTFGYRRLIDALEWCLDLGITCVSAYAFSIDNYKRSEEEVATLMRLAEEKLAHMLAEQDVLRRHSVRVHVLGDLTLAPPGVQKAAADIMAATRHHTSAILNICFSYTASWELQQALDAASASGRPLDDHLYSRDSPPVDLLVRTSGERRLSDFMLRQSSHALLVFTPVLWPNFSFLDLVSAIMQYQRQYPVLQAAQQAAQRSIHNASSRKGPALRHAALEVVGASMGLKTSSKSEGASPRGIATPRECSSPSSDASEDRSREEGGRHSELVGVLAREGLEDAPAGSPRLRQRRFLAGEEKVEALC